MNLILLLSGLNPDTSHAQTVDEAVKLLKITCEISVKEEEARLIQAGKKLSNEFGTIIASAMTEDQLKTYQQLTSKAEEKKAALIAKITSDSRYSRSNLIRDLQFLENNKHELKNHYYSEYKEYSQAFSQLRNFIIEAGRADPAVADELPRFDRAKTLTKEKGLQLALMEKPHILALKSPEGPAIIQGYVNPSPTVQMDPDLYLESSHVVAVRRQVKVCRDLLENQEQAPSAVVTGSEKASTQARKVLPSAQDPASRMDQAGTAANRAE